MEFCSNIRCNSSIKEIEAITVNSYWAHRFPENKEFCIECWHCVCWAAASKVSKKEMKKVVWPIKFSGDPCFDNILKEMSDSLKR